MKKLTNLLDNALSVVTAVALVAMMLHTVIHAVARYAFNAPLYGTNELVAYWYLPTITLLGFLAAQWRKEHISVSIVFDRLKRRNRFEYTVFSRSLGILLCLGFAWFGFAEAMENMATGLTAGVTSIVTWPITFLVPVVFVMLGIMFAADIVAAAKGDEDVFENDPHAVDEESVL